MKISIIVILATLVCVSTAWRINPYVRLGYDVSPYVPVVYGVGYPYYSNAYTPLGDLYGYGYGGYEVSYPSYRLSNLGYGKVTVSGGNRATPYRN